MHSSHTFAIASLAAAMLALGACQNHIQSSATFNGQAWQPTSCRNGAALGFMGVELSDGSGNRIRMSPTASGQADTFWFPANGPTVPLGLCTAITYRVQNSTINNVRNVEGSATFACNGTNVGLQGTVQFSNCH